LPRNGRVSTRGTIMEQQPVPDPQQDDPQQDILPDPQQDDPQQVVRPDPQQD